MENKFDMEAFLKGTPAIDVSGTVRKVMNVSDDWVTYTNIRTGCVYVLRSRKLETKAESSGWRMHVTPVEPVKPEPEKRRKSNARRDSFARAAMQSLLGQPVTSSQADAIAVAAVRIADAIIAELDK